jgi:hypothetical protein
MPGKRVDGSGASRGSNPCTPDAPSIFTSPAAAAPPPPPALPPPPLPPPPLLSALTPPSSRFTAPSSRFTAPPSDEANFFFLILMGRVLSAAWRLAEIWVQGPWVRVLK